MFCKIDFLPLLGIEPDEAVYDIDAQYLRAYQWHPERLVETHPQHRAIFEDFIRACRELAR